MIRCYNCGNVLSDGEYCPFCNSEVEDYKKIVVKSFLLYNEALEAARPMQGICLDFATMR